MVFKLILLAIDIVVIVFFAGFNIDNKSNIWFFFTTFKNVPVFITVLVSYAAGIISALLTVIAVKASRHVKTSSKESAVKSTQNAESEAEKTAKQSKSFRTSILEKIRKGYSAKDTTLQSEE